MLYPSINEIKKKADSRYSLVILAAKRARDLVDGKPALVDSKVKRPVSIAAKEINEDLIKCEYVSENQPETNEELTDDQDVETTIDAPEGSAESGSEEAQEPQVTEGSGEPTDEDQDALEAIPEEAEDDAADASKDQAVEDAPSEEEELSAIDEDGLESADKEE